MSQFEKYLKDTQKLLVNFYLKHGKKGLVKASFVGLISYYVLHSIAKNNGLLRKKKVAGQHVFITGAGSGIGKQMSIRFCRLGSKVTLADVNFEALQEVQKQLQGMGFTQTFIVHCDVSSSEAVKQAAKKCQETLGPVDILINNAGIVSGKKILQNSEAMISKTIAVNTTSHHWTVREFLPNMLQQNRGHIVTIASAAGHVGVNGLVDYSASKFGAVGFDEALRFELRSLKSKVNTTCICPYFINTGMFDGVVSKMDPILPILTEKYATDRIMWAILQDEKVVIMPWILNTAGFCRSFLPTSVFDKVIELLGASESMENFKGRKQQ